MDALSILDLAFVPEGATPAEALRRTLELAQHAEALGYRRFWLAEHHNMVGVASAATSIVIGYVAAGTRTIRVGAGGIMLPNHSPLVIAEQFGTLESLYPKRIDLGLGRAPGTDYPTVRALRRDARSADTFPDDVLELQRLFGPLQPNQTVQAVPGTGLHVPLWILGSSLYGAQLAAVLGLPYAFASHFAPDELDAALALYRAKFRPSAQLAAPYAMVGVNAVVASTDAEARRLFSTVQQGFTNLLRGARGKLQPPLDDIAKFWTPGEEAHVTRMLSCSLVGSPTTVRGQLSKLVARTHADELIVAAAIFDQAARLESYELLADVAALTA
jgi:luciferase family oxidoreductase group 1